MKRLLVVIAACLGMTAQAQINVGYNIGVRVMGKPVQWSDDVLESVKKTTTLFTLQYKDYNSLAEYEEVIKAVWTVTPFKIIKPDELAQYAGKEGYSYFGLGGYYTEKTNTIGSTPGTYQLSAFNATYDLSTIGHDRRNKPITQTVVRISLYPDTKVFEQALKTYHNKFDENMSSFLYNDATFYNWGAGYLKGYLKMVNDLLAKGDSRMASASDEDNDAMAGLKKDTLYVPDYVKIAYSPYTRSETKDDEKDEADAADSYPYPMRYISSDVLNEMILSRTTPFYYLVYVLSAHEKYVNVYRSDKGMIYARYKTPSFNFKNKDLSKLAKQID